MNRYYFEMIEAKANTQTCLMLREGALKNVNKIASITGGAEHAIKRHILQLSDRDEAKPIDFYLSYYNTSHKVLDNIVIEMTGEQAFN